MKITITAGIVLMVVTFGFSVVNAQYTPYIKAYFVGPDDRPDDSYFFKDRKCGVPGTLDTLVVVARNFGWITGVEYCIEYPPCITWLADFGVPVTTIGHTPCTHPSGQGGISTVFQIPLNSNPCIPLCIPIPVINYVLFQWGNCAPDTPISVKPHQLFGGPRATSFPNFDLVYGVGSTSMICPSHIPVEETTWGQIKAIFQE